MTPNASTISLLDSFKAIEILKNLILGTSPYLLYDAPPLTYYVDQVRAVHGRSYPSPHYTFSVTTSISDNGTRLAPEMTYYAQAIVYTTPDSLAEWKLLAEAVGDGSTQEAVESLYSKVEDQAGEITGE